MLAEVAYCCTVPASSKELSRGRRAILPHHCDTVIAVEAAQPAAPLSLNAWSANHVRIVDSEVRSLPSSSTAARRTVCTAMT
jgi:hypothetical protein